MWFSPSVLCRRGFFLKILILNRLGRILVENLKPTIMKKRIKSKETGKIVIEVTCECGNKCNVTVMNSFRKAIEANMKKKRNESR